MSSDIQALVAALRETQTELHEHRVEMLKLRRAIERNAQRLVTGRDAAALLGISHTQFHKLTPIPETKIPGQPTPMYSVARIDALINEWTVTATE